MLVNTVSAVLLMSPDATKLADFYRASLALPLKDEVHDGVPLHYGCEIGSVHFAIHPSEGWPGVPTNNAQSPVLALGTPGVNLVAKGCAA